MRKTLLCKEDEDYDCFVKYIFVCALRCNVIVVSYAVVSNHAHILVLSPDKTSCYRLGDDLKRIYGMYFTQNHHEESPMAGNKVIPFEIRSDRHLRNAMAYIPRNAEDNGGHISEYRWSSFNAYFSRAEECRGRRVRTLSTRETKRTFRTNLSLKKVPWEIDGAGSLIPASACDHRYLEDAFLNNEAFFLRLVGSVNVSEMQEMLILAPRMKLRDSEFRKEAENLCQEWFQTRLSEISRDKKIRLIVHLDRTRHCSIPQLARVFGLDREDLTQLLDHGTRRTASAQNDGMAGD